MKSFKYLPGVSTLKLNCDACIGCALCLEVCPHQVFELRDQKSHIVRLNDCMECGACAINCPVSAINVDSGVGCASSLLGEWLSELKLQFLKKSCC